MSRMFCRVFIELQCIMDWIDVTVGNIDNIIKEVRIKSDFKGRKIC